MSDTKTAEAAEAADLLDPMALSQSLNGFDQLAIQKYFERKFDSFSDDPTMFMRALYFCHLRHEGSKDTDAYRESMNLTLSDLGAKFKNDNAPQLDEDAVAERDRQFAEFVVGTGLSYTVDQYMTLTLDQRAAVIKAANKQRK